MQSDERTEYATRCRSGLCRNCVTSPRNCPQTPTFTGSHQEAFFGGKSWDRLREEMFLYRSMQLAGIVFQACAARPGASRRETRPARATEPQRESTPTPRRGVRTLRSTVDRPLSLPIVLPAGRGNASPWLPTRTGFGQSPGCGRRQRASTMGMAPWSTGDRAVSARSQAPSVAGR
jgi:hypothetical protein